MNPLNAEVRERMMHGLSWYIPDKVLQLHISGEYTPEDAKHINSLVTQELNSSADPLILLIDASTMKRPYNFQEIRSTQTYMDHPKMKRICVAANDRLVKLAMMVIFNLGHAGITLFDDVEVARSYIERSKWHH